MKTTEQLIREYLAMRANPYADQKTLSAMRALQDFL